MPSTDTDPFYGLLVRHQHLRKGEDPEQAIHALLAYRLAHRDHRLNDPEVALAAMVAFIRLGYASSMWKAVVVRQFCGQILRLSTAGPEVCRVLSEAPRFTGSVEDASQQVLAWLDEIKQPAGRPMTPA